jgi:lycopene beta-cyclase
VGLPRGLFTPKINTQNSLLQHFEGWVIKTKKPSFNSKIGTLMDFRLNQEHGTTFMYVLPTSAKEALVEYTLFSKKSTCPCFWYTFIFPFP